MIAHNLLAIEQDNITANKSVVTTLSINIADVSTTLHVVLGYSFPSADKGTVFIQANPEDTDYRKMYVYNNGWTANDDIISISTTSDVHADSSAHGITTEIQEYIDSQLARAILPVQTITDLSNITRLFDKRLVFVEQTNSIYAYDEQSTKTLKGSVVVVSQGQGRWEVVVANTEDTSLSGGNF